jgi:hypothetical protein
MIIIRFFQRSTAKHAMCLAAYSCLFKDSTYHILACWFLRSYLAVVTKK